VKLYYDLHIHSGLSPCGENEMTPNNIVNMSLIKGLDIISVTDHNTAENYPAIKAVADKAGMKVLPGIEITTREEVHILAYFNTYEDAKLISDKLYEALPDIKNRPEIFGEQLIYDEMDNVKGNLEKLLINATTFTVKNVIEMVKAVKGVVIPAHVEKKANGIIGVLGFIPVEYKFDFIEVKSKEYENRFIEKYKKIYNSDAHRLEDISETENYFDCDDVESMIKYIGIGK
jgi:PHP family Zn ribbon phosphoesterase